MSRLGGFLLDFYHAARHRIGRRGAALLFFAELDLIYGYSLAFPPRGIPPTATTRYFATLLPMDVWAAMWIVTGLACLVCAFLRHDRFAYAAAIAVKVMWGGLALMGFWFADLPPTAGAIWVSLAGLVWILSGWRETGQDAEDRAAAVAVVAAEETVEGIEGGSDEYRIA